MKNLFSLSHFLGKLFVLPLFLWAGQMNLSAQSYWDYGWSTDSAVQVTAVVDTYYIDFRINMDSLTEVFHSVSGDDYSTLELPQSYMYDYMDSVGRPMLPHRKIYLQVPEGFNEPLSLSNVVIDYQEYELKNPYYPFQIIDSACLNPFVVYDPAYLSAPDWTQDNRIEIIPEVNFFNEQGFCIDIYPYSYNPITQKIRVIERVRARIEVSLRHYQDPLLTLEGFLNREPDPTILRPGRILIVSPKAYELQLARYAAYRQAQGHAVNIRYLEDIADENYITVSEISSTIVYNEIHDFYDTYQSYISAPSFVILVGSKNVIPYASGVYGNDNNPESDFEYSFPKITYHSQDSATLLMRLAVGRWPVGWNDTTSLGKILNNIYTFEDVVSSYTNRENLKVEIVTGNGNAENEIYSCGQKQLDILKNYHTHLYDGRQYSSCNLYTPVEYKFQNEEIWMFIYDGHGNIDRLGHPLCITTSEIPHLGTHLPPLVFAMACCTNKGNFGKSWITSNPDGKYGISGFFGSTTLSYLPFNGWLSNNIFNQIHFVHIGHAIVAGSQKFFTLNRIYHLKRYVFLGDPVLHTFGNNPNVIFQDVQHNDKRIDSDRPSVSLENQKLTIKSLASNQMQFYVYDISGQLISEGNNCTDYSLDTTDWMSGIYLVVISDGEKTYTQKVVK